MLTERDFEEGLPLAVAHHLALLSGINAATRVLHFGCGDGRATLYLADWFGCPVVGVETDAGRLAHAARAAAERGLSDRVRFQRLDGRRLEVAPGSFDVAVAGPDLAGGRESAIGSLGEALRRGGRLAISDRMLLRHPEPAEDLPRDAGRWDLLTLVEYRALLEDYRLTVVHAESCPFLATLSLQPWRDMLLRGDPDPRRERECREYDRISHRFLTWGMVVGEKRPPVPESAGERARQGAASGEGAGGWDP